MNPEERVLLERTLKLSEDNNALLKKLQRAQRRATIYGFVKLLVIVVPIVAGYIFIQPYLEVGLDNFRTLQSAVQGR